MNGTVHDVLMQFVTLGSSKMEVSETNFFDHPTYVKHVLGLGFVYVLSAGGGGGFPRDWYKTCLCSFSPWEAQKSKFPKFILLIL